MTRYILFILTALIFIGCQTHSAEEYFAEAEKLEQKQKFKEAISLLDKAILKDNRFLGAYINRGADKAAIGDYKGAIADYEKVISLDPDNTLAFFNVGNNLKRLGNSKAAVDFYNYAFSTKGGDRLYLDLQSNNVINLNSFDVPGYEIYYERGIALYQIDSFVMALSDFQNCISKNYMTAESNFWIGNIFLVNSNKEKACEHFNKAKSLGNKDAENSFKEHCN